MGREFDVGVLAVREVQPEEPAGRVDLDLDGRVVLGACVCVSPGSRLFSGARTHGLLGGAIVFQKQAPGAWERRKGPKARRTMSSKSNLRNCQPGLAKIGISARWSSTY